MIYPIVPFPVTLSDISTRFQGHGAIFMPMDALSVFCAQLTRDLLVIAKFLFYLISISFFDMSIKVLVLLLLITLTLVLIKARLYL